MLECTTCNAKNASDSKFCIICGHAMYKECKKCSLKLPVIANFCHECGTKVANGSTPNQGILFI
jgi:ribosomal protein L40E